MEDEHGNPQEEVLDEYELKLAVTFYYAHTGQQPHYWVWVVRQQDGQIGVQREV